MSKKLLLAKIIITNDREPIVNGALLLNDSQIIEVGKKEDFGNLKPDLEVIDHGESLICPGLINLHCHLLYSKADQIDGSNGLFPWIKSLIDKTSKWTEKDYINSINYGIDRALSSGTTYIVENTPSHLSASELSKSNLKSMIGIEIFGSEELDAKKIFLEAQENLSTLERQFKNIDFTFSPHAPYDVSVQLWKELILWSQKYKKPLLTHLEESPEERLWWEEKSGLAINLWKKINKLEPKLKYWKKYNSGIDFLYKNKLLNENFIATHLSQASKEDLKKLNEHNVKLVHCPRSNFYLNNGTANLQFWNKMSFLWGIGTDSIASNNNIDLLEEIKFAINQQNIVYNYKLSAKDAFKSITSNAARVISKDSELGQIKKGYLADFLVYDLQDKSACTYKDPYDLLIWDINNEKDLKEVWINGKRVWLARKLLHK